MTRADGRKYNELRPVEITTGFIKFAEGSVLIRCGDTVVLCNASVEERVPPHVAPGCGWVTAEYSMLPRANRQRSRRDIDKLKLSGRSAEIQRLIGRSLRAAVRLQLVGRQIQRLRRNGLLRRFFSARFGCGGCLLLQGGKRLPRLVALGGQLCVFLPQRAQLLLVRDRL